MNTVLLKNRTGVVGQDVGTAVRLTKCSREGGHDARIVSFIPKRGLTVHGRQDVHLSGIEIKSSNAITKKLKIKINIQLEIKLKIKLKLNSKLNSKLYSKLN